MNIEMWLVTYHNTDGSLMNSGPTWHQTQASAIAACGNNPNNHAQKVSLSVVPPQP